MKINLNKTKMMALREGEEKINTCVDNKSVKQEKNFQRVLISECAFADDIAIIADSEDHLQNNLIVRITFKIT